MLQYILECIAFQLMFLIIYDLFLKRETFFQWNRLYLLATYIISMVLPWIKIEAMKTTVPEAFQVYPEFLWNNNNAAVRAISVKETTFSISWEYALLFGGMFLAALFFSYKLYQIHALKQKGEVHYFKDFTRVIVSNSAIAFSFFRSIFLGDKVIEKDHQSIVQHELVHIRQRHSYDLMFFELMRIVGWFNPLVYVYQNRVSELHEFIADAHVAKTHKKEQYQLLLSEVFQTQHISFINQFFKTSLIKKRIIMLQKTRSNKIWQLKYLLLVPIVMGMLFYSSLEGQESKALTNQEVSEDQKLIEKLEKEVKENIEKSESATELITKYYPHYTRYDSKNPILSKEDFFRERIISKMMLENIKPVEFGDDVQPRKPLTEIPLPSAGAYESYVSQERVFQILDKNLMISINHKELAIRKIEKEDKNLGPGDFVEVANVKDLTGDEIRHVNDKIAQTDFSNRFLFISDDENAFLITKAKQYFDTNSDKKQTEHTKTKQSAVLEVKDVENLSPEEERIVFEKLKTLQETEENWVLIVEDGKTKMKFTRSLDGSYLSGPDGEKIGAKLIYDSTLSEKDKLSITEFLKKNGTTNLEVQKTTDLYNQLVEERQRLLKSTNEKNPIIINLDQQLRDLQKAIEGSKAPSVKVKNRINNPQHLQNEYQQLPNERERLLKKSNEKNPIIVNLDHQIAQLRNAVFLDGETVPFAKVDEVPIFPGCENDDDKRGCFYVNMREHIRKEFRYPKEAHKQGLQGRVAIMFTMNTEGSLSNVKARGPHKLLEDEAVRIISRLPKLKPGLHEGKEVNVAFSIPITFKLSGNVDIKKQTDYENSLDVPFAMVEEVPVFPGCGDDDNKRKCFNQMMQKHISKNFNYPKEAQEKGIQGRVSILLTISEDGSIQDVRMRGPDKILEKEAARIISLLPKMTPGKQKGKAVNVPFSIPISFRLQGKDWEPDLTKLDDMTENIPIFFVDGEASTKEIVMAMNKEDIESINVLKGDAAFKKYGDKGRNGITEITTKKSQDFSNGLNFRSSYDLDPIIYVDGKELSKELLSFINPNDIESMHVLKGEVAQIIYGDKGENGVLVVTTKKLENEESRSNKMILNELGASPLVFINGKESTKKELDSMKDSNTIEHLIVFKKEYAIKKYGKRGENGVIEVLTKEFFNSNPKLAKVHSQMKLLKKERSRLLENSTEDNQIIRDLDAQIDTLQKEEDKLVKEQLK